MNVTELRDAIALYAENFEQGFTDSIDGFIRAAEQRIYNLAKIPASNNTEVDTIPAGTSALPLPTGFLSMNELAITSADSRTTYLLNKEVSFIREAYPDRTVLGRPEFYAQVDDSELVLAPGTDDTYQYELTYFAYPQSITVAGTTWLGENFDQCLLYGALLEASTFMKGETETLALYKERFETAMANLVALVGRRNNTDQYRVGRDNA